MCIRDSVNTMSTAYRGEGKTDARDAFVIAETCRVRRDLPTVEPVTDQSRQLEMLVARRADLVADRVRLINRLRDLLTSVFPTLEREFNFAHHKGAVVLLTGYADPQRIRRVGVARLTEWLRRRHIREAAALAARAVAAANAQRIHVPGKDAASAIASELAADILALDERLHRLDTSIAEAFRAHPQAPVIESMPGFGPILGAMLLAAVGDFRSYPTAGHLAAAAGLVPVPNDSGRRVGNLHRPRRYSRTLRHVLYLAAFSSLRTDGPNKTYYDKKRAAGRTHKQALIALSRRRCDVLWALLRDGRCFALQPPARPPQAA